MYNYKQNCLSMKGFIMYFDHIEVPVPCSVCREKFKLCVGKIKNSPTVICPHCQHRMDIGGSDLKAATYWVDKCISRLKRMPKAHA